MARLVNPVAWNGTLIQPGEWVKPDDMPYPSVTSIFASGDLVDPTPEDLGVFEDVPDSEWPQILKETRQLLGPKPCPSCVEKI